MRVHTWMPLTALTCVAAAHGPDEARAESAVTTEVGMVTFVDELTTAQVGLRLTSGPPHAPRVEFAIAVLPEAFAYSSIVEMAELGLGIPIPLHRRLTLDLGVGGAQVGVGGSGFGGTALGVYGRAGLTARASERVSLGIGYTERRFMGDGEGMAMPSVTAGLTWHAPSRPASEGKGDYVGTGRLERKRPK